MNRRTFIKTLPALGRAGRRSAQLCSGTGQSHPNLQPIALPKPEKDGGKSVLAALWERQTNRDISDRKLPLQTLSNLLWAAWGVNRQTGPRWADRQDRRIGQQFAGDRPLCGHA